MTRAQTAPSQAPETPTDTPVPPPKARRKPTAGNRYQLFDDGDGDYRIYELAKSDAGLPKGALLPIAGVPGFPDGAAARKFINNSGNLLQGKQVMILKGLEICSIAVQTVTKVGVKFKPKRPVTGPAASEEGGE